MVELFALIILIISFLGIIVIVFQKIPILAEMPEREGAVREKFWKKLKNKIFSLPFFKDFSAELFLQKILSKIRVLTLKTESKTSHWLGLLRQRAQKKNGKDDKYWEELKNNQKNGENSE